MEKFGLTAKELIENVEKELHTCSKGMREELKLREIFEEVHGILQKEAADNTFLIGLERFYQSVSLVIGLSHLEMTEEARLAWRAYDRFHFTEIKPQLRLYGWIAAL
ncbi:helicase BlpT [Streptococcus pneumoniae]